MALPNTLTVAQFFDLLGVAPDGLQFGLDFIQQRAMTGGGSRLVSDRGPPMLSCDITTIPMLHAEALGIMALINSRGGGLKSFLLCDPRLKYPSTDPTGVIIGATVPLLGTITDRLHVAFTAFPNAYVMPLGTYFSIVFDTSRYYLGQFVEAKTASGGGAITATEIFPPLPQEVTGTPAIVIKKPSAKFKPVAGTAFISAIGGLHSAVTFSAEQTYEQ